MVASNARLSPSAFPKPINAAPLCSMAERISLISALMIPFLVIISAIERTPVSNTSFALLKASFTANLGYISGNLSLFTTNVASTYSFRFCKPSCALERRSCPSIEKGTVTTATVKIPISCAIRAITGVAPVPVPPPNPVVRKSISVSFNNSFISCSWSSAA